ncbi:MAG: NADH-quinone oxidoreductase subunit C [Lachnospiraceae bacterium]|nr:NADH-quinone oxidoreductase subunit C [Lachnospiraceae bacterium]
MQENKKITITKDEVREVAQRMRNEGRMLTLIHGFVDKEGKKHISYEYDFGCTLERYEVVGEESLPTISDIFDDGAAWPERELNELMGMEFEGLDTSKRLFMPEHLLEGQGQILVTPLSELREKNILD